VRVVTYVLEILLDFQLLTALRTLDDIHNTSDDYLINILKAGVP